MNPDLVHVWDSKLRIKQEAYFVNNLVVGFSGPLFELNRPIVVVCQTVLEADLIRPFNYILPCKSMSILIEFG